MSKSNKGLTLFFLISFFLSSVIFLFLWQLISRADFAMHLNNLNVYLLGLSCYFFIPLLLFLLKSILKKYFFWTIIPIFIFFFSRLLLNNQLDEILSLLTNNIFLILFLIILSVIVTLIIIKLQETKLSVKPPPTKFFNTFFYLMVLMLIIFLVYNPKYKYSFERIGFFGYESFHQFHHVNFFILPAHEILLGKKVLVDVAAQYGVLLTYITSIFLKLTGVTYSNFVLYTMFISIVYCWLLFFFLKRITKSWFISLLGLLVYIKLVVFRFPQGNGEMYIFPSTTPIRYFFDIIIAWFLYNYFEEGRKYKIFLILAFTVGLSFFYNTDFGLAILAGFILSLFLDIYLSIYNEKKDEALLKPVKFFLPLILIFIFFITFISIFSYTRSGHWPDWSIYLTYITGNTPGLKQLWFPSIRYFYWPLMIYLVGYYYLLNRVWLKKINGYQPLFFLLIYGTIIFIQYINKLETNHFIVAVHPAIVIFFLLWGEFKKKLTIQADQLSFNKIFLPVSFFVIIATAILSFPPPVISTVFARINYRYSSLDRGYFYWSYPGTDFYLKDNDGKDFQLAANKITQLTKNNNSIVIVSRYSPLLYLITGKTSLINHPNPEYDFYTVNEFISAAEKIKTKKPQYIFVYSEKYNQSFGVVPIDMMSSLWNRVKDDYKFQEHAGVVDVYKYQP